LGPNFGELSNEALRTNFPSKTFISFPSIFFGGLFPQLTYLRKLEGGTLQGPLTDYHDTRIIHCFLNNESESQCLAKIISSDPAEIIYYRAALDESTLRDKAVNVPVMDILLNEMQKKAPLFTFNHPTNRVLWCLVERILKELNEPVPKDVSLPRREYLSNITAIIPTGISEHLGVSWRCSEYALWDNKIPLNELVSDFYATYRNTEKFVEICKKNVSRFNLPVKLPD